MTDDGSPGLLDPQSSQPAKRKRGGQRGNRNALKHGLYSAEQRAFRANVRQLLRDVKATLAEIKKANPHSTRRKRPAVSEEFVQLPRRL